MHTTSKVFPLCTEHQALLDVKKTYLCVSRLALYKVSPHVADYKAVYFPWSSLPTHCRPTRVL